MQVSRPHRGQLKFQSGWEVGVEVLQDSIAAKAGNPCCRDDNPCTVAEQQVHKLCVSEVTWERKPGTRP